MSIYSTYYGRLIDLSEEEAEILLNIYVKVAEEMDFEPELGEDDTDVLIDMGDTYYDMIAYHVESFGREHDDYGEISYLFD